MTHDDHQRERMRVWAHAFLASTALCAPHQNADMALAEFDKRFPAPSAAAPVEPVASHAQPRVTCPAPVMPMAVDSYTGSLSAVQTIDVSELASLRQKARLWDAVIEGVNLHKHNNPAWGWSCSWSGSATYNGERYFPTAEEAVESAIAQGALK